MKRCVKVKVGDKVYCTEGFEIPGDISFTANKIYTICEIDKFNFYIQSDGENRCNFGIIEEESYRNTFKFENHFISLKKSRKQKLDELNRE